MKNIAIFGSSRSGKSTLAKMIAKKHTNYHIIIGDDIRSVFQEVLPSTNINATGGAGMKEDFPKFLSCLFYKNIKRNRGEFNYIIETCDMTPNKAYEFFKRSDTILLFVGIAHLSVEQHFKNIRKYQTERDWTFYQTDEYMLRHCKNWIEKSIEYEKECNKLNIWYVDTSISRDEVLNNTLEKIEEMMESIEE